jgi:hypothetical protein
MSTPLIPIEIESIYKKGDQSVLLPSRMAKCTPDTLASIRAIQADLAKDVGNLVLSDLFRSYEMQLQAFMDWKSGKKQAFSPPPGGSMHEAGRAFDLDLSQIKISLRKFWNIAKKYGITPIISKPDENLNEAWHFDKRGSHQLVYDYFQRNPNWGIKPYKAMSASAIMAIGIHVDDYGNKQKEANIQFGLLRLGKDNIGKIDGIIGPKTRSALGEEGITSYDIAAIETEIESKLQLKFPDEYSLKSILYEEPPTPESVIG